MGSTNNRPTGLELWFTPPPASPPATQGNPGPLPLPYYGGAAAPVTLPVSAEPPAQPGDVPGEVTPADRAAASDAARAVYDTVKAIEKGVHFIGDVVSAPVQKAGPAEALIKGRIKDVSRDVGQQLRQEAHLEQYRPSRLTRPGEAQPVAGAARYPLARSVESVAEQQQRFTTAALQKVLDIARARLAGIEFADAATGLAGRSDASAQLASAIFQLEGVLSRRPGWVQLVGGPHRTSGHNPGQVDLDGTNAVLDP